MKERDDDHQRPTPFSQTYFHGTKADLKVGDFIEPGNHSNYGQRKNAKYIFLTSTLDAAIWGAELAIGEGRERIYLVEPTGPIEDDPDLTDKSFRAIQQNRIVLLIRSRSLARLRYGMVTPQNKSGL